jgi:hypothetical protein
MKIDKSVDMISQLPEATDQHNHRPQIKASSFEAERSETTQPQPLTFDTVSLLFATINSLAQQRFVVAGFDVPTLIHSNALMHRQVEVCGEERITPSLRVKQACNSGYCHIGY